MKLTKKSPKSALKPFWERWALPIGLFLLILLGGLFFYFNWQNRTTATALSCANSFEAAVQTLALNPLEAEAQLSAISTNCGGYSQLAAFKRGDALLFQGLEAEALQAWQAYAADPAHQINLRNLALSKVAWHGSGILEPEVIDAAIAHLETLPAYAFYTPVLRAVEALEAGNTLALRAPCCKIS